MTLTSGWSGKGIGGVRGAASLVAGLEDRHLGSSLGQVGGGDQAVVAPAYHNHVVRISSHRPSPRLEATSATYGTSRSTPGRGHRVGPRTAWSGSSENISTDPTNEPTSHGPPQVRARGVILRLLLSSAGITNASIHDALVDLLDRPIAESSALCIPTASYANPGGAGHAWKFIAGREPQTPMCELGWKSLGVLELTALPSLDEAHWVPMVEETDVLLVSGGDPLFLCHWMRESGLADLMPSLRETVYVGLSAGSMVMAPSIGQDFVGWKPPIGGDETLGVVGFSIFPHLDHEDLPENTMADAERWAAGMPAPCYAIDDQTAIKVVDDAVDVVSEGHWKLFPR